MIPGLAFSPVAAQVGGVVPGATNWPNIIGAGYYSASKSGAPRTITGISEPIMLRAEITVDTSTVVGNLDANVNGSDEGNTPITLASFVDFTVENGDSVLFSAYGGGAPGWDISATVTVKYKSAGSSTFDQTLDTFTISLTSTA